MWGIFCFIFKYLVFLVGGIIHQVCLLVQCICATVFLSVVYEKIGEEEILVLLTLPISFLFFSPTLPAHPRDGQITAILDQKNYVEELNRHLK